MHNLKGGHVTSLFGGQWLPQGVSMHQPWQKGYLLPAEQRHAVEQHVQDSLLAIGIAATLIGQGPDLDPVDDPQAVALYNTLTRPRRLAHGGSVSTTMGVRLRPTSVRCASCAMYKDGLLYL